MLLESFVEVVEALSVDIQEMTKNAGKILEYEAEFLVKAVKRSSSDPEAVSKAHVQQLYGEEEGLTSILACLMAAKDREKRRWFAIAYLAEVSRFLRRSAYNVCPTYAIWAVTSRFNISLDLVTKRFATTETLAAWRETVYIRACQETL